jgi:hypothetical protein
MKQLSDTLAAMRSNGDLSKNPQTGSMTKRGEILRAPRNQPLTQKQLTAIAFNALRSGFEIILEEKQLFSPENHFDEQSKQTGSGTKIDIIADINPNCPENIIISALTVSPPESYLKHLSHLAMHKKFGSNDMDRAVLLTDYVSSLATFPEFIVFMVCRHYWENDRRPFLPFIGEIKEACQLFKSVLERELARKKQPILIGTENKPVSNYYEDPLKNPIRRHLCDFLVQQGKPDYFTQSRFWSNYDLEKEALRFGWEDSISIPVKSKEELALIGELTQQSLRNLGVE